MSVCNIYIYVYVRSFKCPEIKPIPGPFTTASKTKTRNSPCHLGSKCQLTCMPLENLNAENAWGWMLFRAPPRFCDASQNLSGFRLKPFLYGGGAFLQITDHRCRLRMVHIVFSHFATIWSWNAHVLVIAVQGLIRTKSIQSFYWSMLWPFGVTKRGYSLVRVPWCLRRAPEFEFSPSVAVWAPEEPAVALVDPAAVLKERPAREGPARRSSGSARRATSAHEGSAAALEEPTAALEGPATALEEPIAALEGPAAIDELLDPPLLLGSRTPLMFSLCRSSGGTEWKRKLGLGTTFLRLNQGDSADVRINGKPRKYSSSQQPKRKNHEDDKKRWSTGWIAESLQWKTRLQSWIWSSFCPFAIAIWATKMIAFRAFLAFSAFDKTPPDSFSPFFSSFPINIPISLLWPWNFSNDKTLSSKICWKFSTRNVAKKPISLNHFGAKYVRSLSQMAGVPGSTVTNRNSDWCRVCLKKTRPLLSSPNFFKHHSNCITW